MAGEVVDCGEEFWLPSEFLADDFFLEEKNYYCKSESGGGGVAVEDEGVGFGSEFPCDGSESNLSSPGESVTESDEEDYMAGLTRRMAHSFLHDSDDKVSENQKLQAAGLACSPQSPLCAAGAWSALSSRGSSKGPSQVSSPPSPLDPVKDIKDNIMNNTNAWDLLYAAAGEVVRMRLNEEAEQMQQQKLHGSGLLGPPRKTSPPSFPIPPKSAPAIGGYCANPPLTHHQLQVNQFQQLRQQQLLKQQYSAAWGRYQLQQQQSRSQQLRCRPVPVSSGAWPPLQPQPPPPAVLQHGGSGMRAIFLGGVAGRKQSGGTGVFLPRRVGSPTDLRKKPACSTVLVPAKVVQALNLNLEDMRAQPRHPAAAFFPDHDAIAASNSSLLSQKRSHGHVLRPHHQPTPAMNQEIRLPPEWTY